MKYKYLLFDLDGTVSESAEGIRASLEYAINTLGAPMPDLSDYTRYVGPPLIDTFLNLVGLDPGTAERGAQLYRDYYNEKGKYLNRVYKGIPELLGRLREEDVKMCICSSKYELFAEEIIGSSDLAATLTRFAALTSTAAARTRRILSRTPSPVWAATLSATESAQSCSATRGTTPRARDSAALIS